MSTDFVDEGDMEELDGMVDELLEQEEGLTDWEIDFVESLFDWDGCFTERQAEMLDKVYKRVLGG